MSFVYSRKLLPVPSVKLLLFVQHAQTSAFADPATEHVVRASRNRVDFSDQEIPRNKDPAIVMVSTAIRRQAQVEQMII